MLLSGWVILAALTTAGPGVTDAAGVDISGCLHQNISRTITGCSAVIASDNATPANKFAAYIFRGIAYRLTHKVDLAIADANYAISLFPGNYEGYGERAIDEMSLGEPSQAVADDTKAISLYGFNDALYDERSLAEQDMGAWDKALADSTEAVKLNPKNALAFLHRAFIYDHQTNWTAAIADNTQAIQIAPKLEEAFFDRGVDDMNLGNYQQAVADNSQAVKLNGLDGVAWNNLCYSQAIIGTLQDVIANCNNAILLNFGDPTNEEISLNSRAYAYLQMRNYPLSIKDYKASLVILPTDADSLFGLSIAEQASGDAASAARDAAAAQKIDPSIVKDFANHHVP